VILVALGTHPQPMDALLIQLDLLAGSGALEEPVVVQSAAYNYRPRNLQTLGIVGADELDRRIAAADVVISHAGPGILASARAAGRVPVVVPRRHASGEHVDDHQVRYARHLATQPGYEVVFDLAELPAAIERARTAVPGATVPDRSAAIAALRRLTGCDAAVSERA
jgi:UDP-N-acetylglucosamine transferase subunit ALG13